MSIREPTLSEFDGKPATDFERRWGITQDTLKERVHGRAMPSADNERLCEECGARVTITNTMGEVGHENGHSGGKERCSQYNGGDE